MANFKLHRVLKKYEPKREKMFVNLSHSEHILIFVNGESLQELNNFAAYLKTKITDKKVVILGFTKKLSKDELMKKVHFDKLITKKELNFWNNPTKKDIEWIHAQRCDILINLDLKSNNALNILTAASSAKTKCGHKSDIHNLFDLMINLADEKTPKALLEQLLFYLNTIQVKN